jgi:bifunctional DNA-binding transcriptional regulator/antitoxin component of YhaV-PrlF toxin-antitoxin module
VAINSTFLTIQSRGVIALPPAMRRRLGLDRPGAQVELVERDDGVLELRPHLPVPVIALSAADSAFVADLLLNPPEPNEHLRRAMERHRRDISS